MSRFDSNGNKVHSSTSEQGARIVFLASGAVSPRKGDKQSESLVRVARSATIECADCHRDFPAPTFDGNAVCPECWDNAGMENEHADGWHEQPNPDCAACRAVQEQEPRTCEGHEPGPFEPMGITVFCDGRCR